MAIQVSRKRPCVLLIIGISFLLAVAVSGGLIKQCPQDTECTCLSVRMVNPTVIVKCRRVLIEEFPTMQEKVIAFFVRETRASTLTHRSFVNATNLGMISVIDNAITYIEEGALRLLPNLEILELVNVKLEDTSALHGLRTLTALKLSDNFLKSFATDSLTDVPNMKELELDGNFITQFRFSSDVLQKLNLSRNQLHGVQKESFKDLRSLITLDLSKNHIEHLQNIASQCLQSLNLAYNQIVEIDETIWQDLPELKSIDLSNNRIIDLGGVSGFPLLQSLNASNNFIDSLNSINGLETLVHLDVGKNRIRTLGDMPDLPLLQSLCLAENDIEYFDGNDLQNSPLLSVLSLVRNRLTGIGSLSPGLESLYLQENMIEHIEEDAFAHSTTLEYIDVGSNNLSDLGAFKNMPSLSTLNVSENSIRELSAQGLQGCPKLTVLDLSKNLLEELPTFPASFWLFQVYLDFNPILVLDWNKLRNLHSLRMLSLNGTKITSIPPTNAFLPITQISIKNYNASIQISQNAFALLVTLAELCIENLASVLPGTFASSHFLKKLELRSGDISEVTREWQLTSLEYADLSHNRINRIDIDSRSMRRLKSMILTNNNINNVSFVNHLANIRELNLRHNRIRYVPKDAFALCRLLTVLDLSYNMIEDIKVGTFDINLALNRLYLSYNMLTNFSLAYDTSTDNERVWKYVSVLHLDGNHISKLDPKTFKSGGHSLKEINVAHNPLHDINETTFHSNFGLRSIDLSHSDISNFSTGLLSSLSYIKRLSLNNVTCLKDSRSLRLDHPQSLLIERLEFRDNHLTRIPDLNHKIIYELDISRNNLSGNIFQNVSGTQDLTYLDVSTNNVDELKIDLIQNAPNLKHLNISGNKLNRINFNVISRLPYLKMIDLTNNQLEGIPLNNMEKVKANLRINITGNPVLCDCSLRNYSAKLHRCLGFFGDDAPEGKVVCQRPLRLSGKNIGDIALNQFQCPPEADPSKSQMSGMVGDQIRLECPIRDPTGVTVTWLNVTEAHPNLHTAEDNRFLIDKMSTNDSDSNYQCIATNQEGTGIFTVRLHVRVTEGANGTTYQNADLTTSPGRESGTEALPQAVIPRLVGVTTLRPNIPFNNGTRNDQPEESPETQEEEANILSASSLSEHSQTISMGLPIICAIFNVIVVLTL